MAGFAVTTFCQDAAEDVIIRWRIAEEYVADFDMNAPLNEQAVRVLIRQDVPKLLQEIIRLREICGNGTTRKPACPLPHGSSVPLRASASGRKVL